MADRWDAYGAPSATVADTWDCELVGGPTPLFGANGILLDPTGRELVVTQVFGTQVTNIDIDSGAHRVFSGIGGGINEPDDGIFLSDGTFYATEPPNDTVSFLRPDGTAGTLRDDLPSINGITTDSSRTRLFADEFRPGGRVLELDPTGERAPTVLADDCNGPNALAVGPDGGLWFPQVLAGEIWRYDLDEGSLRMVFDDLLSPTAVKFDSQGRLHTSQAGNGEVTRFDISSGARETVAQVGVGIDNLAIGPGDRLFVSHFVDGQVAEVVGEDLRVLATGGFVGPYGLAPSSSAVAFVADGMKVGRLHADGSYERLKMGLIDLPGFAVGGMEIAGGMLILAQHGALVHAPDGGRPTRVAKGLDTVVSLTPLSGDTCLVVERGSGSVHRAGVQGIIETVASGVTHARGAAETPDGTIWVGQSDRAPLVAVRDGATVREVSGFGSVDGVAVSADGRTVLASDTGNRRVVAVDAESGAIETVIDDAPIGPPTDGKRLLGSFAPLLAEPDGSFLVGCNGDGSIRRVRRT